MVGFRQGCRDLCVGTCKQIMTMKETRSEHSRRVWILARCMKGPAFVEPQKNSMLHEEAGQVPEASALSPGTDQKPSFPPMRHKDVLPFRSQHSAPKRIALAVSARASGSGAHGRQHSYIQPLVVPLPIQGVKQMIPSQQPLPIPVVEDMIPS